MLRLHVLANSNTRHDQQLKHAVRNEILKQCGFLFETCSDAEDATQIAQEHSGFIGSVARKELIRQGCLHPVSVRVGKTRFPTKRYGTVRLPQGRYTALEIRIGQGQGQNWWCVMYPPLCLTGEVVSADHATMEQLKTHLSPSAYAMITEETHITPVFRFKIAEILGKWL
ncbi:MAG: stage II sporulation protein R [Clostridia bacterium]|nr:stage II sporulation protein R [Clostridia bacterium]